MIPPAADLAHSGTSSTSPAPIHPAENLVVRARNEVKDATPAHADREERVGETGKAFDAEVGRREGADVDSQPEVGKARAGGEQETDGAELGEGKAKSEAGTLTEEDGQEKHGNGLVDQTNYLPPRYVPLFGSRQAAADSGSGKSSSSSSHSHSLCSWPSWIKRSFRLVSSFAASCRSS